MGVPKTSASHWKNCHYLQYEELNANLKVLRVEALACNKKNSLWQRRETVCRCKHAPHISISEPHNGWYEQKTLTLTGFKGIENIGEGVPNDFARS